MTVRVMAKSHADAADFRAALRVFALFGHPPARNSSKGADARARWVPVCAAGFGCRCALAIGSGNMRDRFLLWCAVLTLAAGLAPDAAAQPFVGPPPPACVAPNKSTQA